MSNNRTPQAAKSFPHRSPEDILQFRDAGNQTLGWFSSDGKWHYIGDGTGVLPTSTATTIVSLGTNHGSQASSPNMMILFDHAGNTVGWINSFGQPGGSLSTLGNGPIGWIDPNGAPSGSGPIL
jgi:hypothetical protein